MIFCECWIAYYANFYWMPPFYIMLIGYISQSLSRSTAIFYDALDSNLFPQTARIVVYSFRFFYEALAIFWAIYYPNGESYKIQIGNKYDYFSKTFDLNEIHFSARCAIGLFFFKYLISSFFFPKNYVMYSASLCRK